MSIRESFQVMSPNSEPGTVSRNLNDELTRQENTPNTTRWTTPISTRQAISTPGHALEQMAPGLTDDFDDSIIDNKKMATIHDGITIEPLKDDNDYATWEIAMLTKLHVHRLRDMLQEKEVFDESWEQRKKALFDSRRRLLHGIIVGAISVDNQVRFRHEILQNDPVALWKAIEDDYSQGNKLNTVFMRQEIYGRRLRPNEKVTTYVRIMKEKQREISKNGDILTDDELAKIILTNAIDVYDSVVRDYDEMNRNSKTFTLREAIGRLESAERMNAQYRNVTNGGKGIRPNGKAVMNITHGKKKFRGNNRNNNKYGPGRPHESNTRGGKRSGQQQGPTCWTCGSPEHKANNCPQGNPKKKTKFERINCIRIGMIQTNIRNNYHNKHEKDNQVEWVLDSGAQVNVCGDIDWFSELEPYSGDALRMANGMMEFSSQIGSVSIRILNSYTNKYENRLLSDVHYAPNIEVNIISLHWMQTVGGCRMIMAYDQQSCVLTKDKLELKFEKDQSDGLYKIWVEKRSLRINTVQIDGGESRMRLLHARHDHMAQKELVRLYPNLQLKEYQCIPCVEAKLKRMSYKRTKPERASTLYEKLSSDINTVNVQTLCKSTMFLLLVDEYSKYIWAFLLERKSDATYFIKSTILEIERNANHRVRVFHSDQGGEYLGNELRTFLSERGIRQLFTNPYSPQENAIVEKLNDVLMCKVRAMLMGTRLPACFWGEALLHCVGTRNALPRDELAGLTPRQAIQSLDPQPAAIVTWGCICHVHIPTETRRIKDKPSTRAKLCLFVGYSHDTKGYKVMDLKTGGMTSARYENCKFHETFTVERKYMELLMELINGNDVTLPEYVEIVSMKSSMDSYPRMGHLGTYLETQIDLQWKSDQFPVEEDKDYDISVRDISDSNDNELTSLQMTQHDDKMGNLPVTNISENDSIEGTNKSKRQMKSKRKRKTSTINDKSSKHKKKGIKVLVGEKVVNYDKPTTSEDDGKQLNEEDTRVSDQGNSMDSNLNDRPTVERRVTRGMSGITKKNPKYIMAVGRLHVKDIVVPKYYKEAMASKYVDEWRSAMKEELDSLLKHETWKKVPRNKAKGVIITNRWLYAVKGDENGILKRFKARLIIHGKMQTYPMNYSETYAPVVRFETIRLVLTIALGFKWNILQYDIKTAFLHGKLEEQVFTNQPIGFEDGSNRVCELQRALYGLKQAPRCWNLMLHKTLCDFGLTRCESDHGLYRQVGGDSTQDSRSGNSPTYRWGTGLNPVDQTKTRDSTQDSRSGNSPTYRCGTGLNPVDQTKTRDSTQDSRSGNSPAYRWGTGLTPVDQTKTHELLMDISGKSELLVTVYVDDLLIIGPQDKCELLAAKLKDVFEFVELGPVKYLLGVEVLVDRSTQTIMLSQEQYINDILKKFHMENCNGAWTPEPLKDSKLAISNKEEDIPYREVVGSLQYLVSVTRPDLAHVVRHLGKYLSCFTQEHYAKVKRVLRYLKMTKNYGLTLQYDKDVNGNGNGVLTAYTDSDYANDAEDSLSVGGYAVYFNGCLISYSSKKHTINALSTMEAEYISMCNGAREIEWMKGLLWELGITIDSTVMYGDNMSAISMTNKPGKHSRSKYIANKWHFVRAMVESGRLTVKHCISEQMVADIFTKPLSQIKFEKHRATLGVLPNVRHSDEC